MKKNMIKNITIGLTFAMVLGFTMTHTAKAASYDIKEDVVQTGTIAAKVEVKAEKVMDGVTDIVINTYKGKEKQRILLQCDSTTQSITAFYYMKDVLGGKASGANGFAITVYDNDKQELRKGGEAEVFDGANTKQNLRKGLERLSVLKGTGYIVFQFHESINSIDREPTAFSMMIPSSYYKNIIDAVDSVEGSGGCNIDGGFTSTYSLKNLTDSI